MCKVANWILESQNGREIIWFIACFETQIFDFRDDRNRCFQSKISKLSGRHWEPTFPLYALSLWKSLVSVWKTEMCLCFWAITSLLIGWITVGYSTVLLDSPHTRLNYGAIPQPRIIRLSWMRDPDTVRKYFIFFSVSLAHSGTLLVASERGWNRSFSATFSSGEVRNHYWAPRPLLKRVHSAPQISKRVSNRSLLRTLRTGANHFRMVDKPFTESRTAPQDLQRVRKRSQSPATATS